MKTSRPPVVEKNVAQSKSRHSKISFLDAMEVGESAFIPFDFASQASVSERARRMGYRVTSTKEIHKDGSVGFRVWKTNTQRK